MINSLESAYPLEKVDDADLKRLCQTLWGWKLCSSCQSGQACNGHKCPWKRAPIFTTYFAFYKDLTSAYVPELLYGHQPALRSHEDVADIIRLIKSRPGEVRSRLTRDYFSLRGGDDYTDVTKLPPPADQHRAFNTVVKVMTMLNCSAEQQASGVLDLGVELGTLPLPWHHNISFSDFTLRAFPRTDVGDLNFLDYAGKLRDVKSSITARRLERLARLSFRGTDDIRNHLRLDTRAGIVEIYHYTSVLKEHLAAASNNDHLSL
ncbi:hypothetical protein N7495_009695 [Penicillium taxi]|uniref:uncharacterized protein n=1 Tax=Penicillium taxi TaxID=168475 RepID=UPI0025450CA3|nr:uncharacterized protein N7495_009695 [Penicillium taxi]KAJ5885185.1 hypothetical protein N7495_009695 [Penicillium taxi]